MLRDKMQMPAFADAWVMCLMEAVNETADGLAYELTCVFVAEAVAAAYRREEPLGHELLWLSVYEVVLGGVSHRDDDKRYRYSRLLNALLKRMEDGPLAAEERTAYCKFVLGICQGMIIGAEYRLKCDVVARIREEAATTLGVFVHVSDDGIPVTQNLCQRLRVETSWGVRKAIVETLGPVSSAMPAVLECVDDPNENVRLVAHRLASEYPLADLGPSWRGRVLARGLDDLSGDVNDHVVSVLLPKWLESCDGNHLRLLTILDPVNGTESCKTVFELLLRSATNVTDCAERLPLNVDKLVPSDAMTNEAALMWRLTAENLRLYQGLGATARVVPTEFETFADYLDEYLKQQRDNVSDAFTFVATQLVAMTLNYPKVGGDSPNGVRLVGLLGRALHYGADSDALCACVADRLVHLIPDEEKRFAAHTGFARELSTPVTLRELRAVETEIAYTGYRTVELRRELRQATGNAATSAVLEKKLEVLGEVRRDALMRKERIAIENKKGAIKPEPIATTVRVMRLMVQATRTAKTTSETLERALRLDLLPAMNYCIHTLGVLAAKAASHCAILDREHAVACAPKFRGIWKSGPDSPDHAKSCAEGLLGAMVAHGCGIVAESRDILREFADFAEDGVTEVRVAVVTRLTELVMHRRAEDCELLVRLVVMWQRQLADQGPLLEVLADFFRAYLRLVRPQGTRLLVQSLLPALRVLCTDPTSRLDPLQMSKSLARLYDVTADIPSETDDPVARRQLVTNVDEETREPTPEVDQTVMGRVLQGILPPSYD